MEIKKKNSGVNVIAEGVNFCCCSVQEKNILIPSTDSRDKNSGLSTLHLI